MNRFVRFFRKSKLDAQLDSELRFHIEQQTAANIAAGMSPAEARRCALAQFGGLESRKEEARDARGTQFVESLIQDVRFALRMLRKSPGFTAVAILTLALGIGANTAIFSIVDAVLLHPLPYKDPGKLVWLTESMPAIGVADNNVSWLDMQDWKRQSTVFEGIAGYTSIGFTLTDLGSPQVLGGQCVSEGYFSVMGVAPLLGRTFTPEEHQADGSPVVVISRSFWKGHFAGDAGAIGKTLVLNGKPWTIVGVMPAGFGRITHTQVWAPFEQVVQKMYLAKRQFSWAMYAIGRLKSGVSFHEAEVNLTGISDRLAQEYPKTTGGFAVLLPLSRHIAGDLRPALLLLSAAVLFLLLIVCGNIAGLLLVKSAARGKEIAVRLALGAGKGRLFRQLMVESAVLSITGGILGVIFAWQGTQALAALLPRNAAFPGAISLNTTVLIFAGGIVLFAGLLSGLAPALVARRANLLDAMKTASLSVQGAHQRMHRLMVITEVSLAVMLLIGSGLMLRSMKKLFRVSPGFDTHHLLTESVYLNRARITDATKMASVYENVIRRVDSLPGVESAAAVFPLPFTNQIADTYLAIKGQPSRAGEVRAVHYVLASSDYFRTLHVPLVEGRTFSEADTPESPRVAVIDQELARRYWPAESAVGRQIKLFVQDFGDAAQKPTTIVGVVGTVKASGLDADLGGDVYLPSSQGANGAMTLVVRTRTAPLSLARAVESAVHNVTPDSPVFRVQTMDQTVQQTQSTRNLALKLLGGFSLAALLLAALGLYGVISYLVSQRTREIGIRMALGAQRRDVLRLVLGQSLKMALVGTGVGLAAAMGLTRLMSTLLYGVSATDPITFGAVAVVLMSVALAACYFPARRAMRVDPMVALRYE